MSADNEREQSVPELGAHIPRRGNRLSKAGARAVMKAAGWQIVGEVPDEPKIVLVGAPHTSNWDYIFTVLTVYSLGVDIHFVAKQSLFDNPLGGLMRFTGGVPIDRATSEARKHWMAPEAHFHPGQDRNSARQMDLKRQNCSPGEYAAFLRFAQFPPARY